MWELKRRFYADLIPFCLQPMTFAKSRSWRAPTHAAGRRWAMDGRMDEGMGPFTQATHSTAQRQILPRPHRSRSLASRNAGGSDRTVQTRGEEKGQEKETRCILPGRGANKQEAAQAHQH